MYTQLIPWTQLNLSERIYQRIDASVISPSTCGQILQLE